MTKAKADPFVDRPTSCKCTYCRRQDVREFLDAGLAATREGGHPRPKAKTVADALGAQFGTPENTARSILRCCKAWTDPWPGDG